MRCLFVSSFIQFHGLFFLLLAEFPWLICVPCLPVFPEEFTFLLFFRSGGPIGTSQIPPLNMERCSRFFFLCCRGRWVTTLFCVTSPCPPLMVWARYSLFECKHARHCPGELYLLFTFFKAHVFQLIKTLYSSLDRPLSSSEHGSPYYIHHHAPKCFTFAFSEIATAKSTTKF